MRFINCLKYRHRNKKFNVNEKTFLNDLINNENVKPKGKKYHNNVKQFVTTL